MWPKFKQKIWQWRAILITAPSVAGLVIMGSCLGLFQLLEWTTLDQFFRWRATEQILIGSPEPPDPRIVVITIDESDINRVKQWPIPDSVLAQLIEKVKKQHPRAIGLNLYRNLPIAPGHQELIKVYKQTPNLIGIEKAIGEPVAPPSELEQLKQIGFTDLVLDADGKVRRALLSIKQDDGKLKLSLGAKLALMYLETEGIQPENAKSGLPSRYNRQGGLVLGKALLFPFMGNDGGYVNADSGGYQILLNYRGSQTSFYTVSMTEVLEDRIPKNLMGDGSKYPFTGRIVLIGSTAESINELFHTPYSNSFVNVPERTPGVFIHANLVSQLISAALDGRPMMQVWSDPLEWLWILLWSVLGSSLRWRLLQGNLFRHQVFPNWLLMVFCIVPIGGLLLGSCYLAFLNGWWLPMVAPAISLSASVLVITGYYNQELQRLASVDSLTQVANRRYFEEYLEREWWRGEREQKYLSLILCDVDWFKLYNDTYGHQAGDSCLQQVVRAIRDSVRRADLVARYGGEEFVVILPNTDINNAIHVAERICSQVRSLAICHRQSPSSDYVTISCGVATMLATVHDSPVNLIQAADQALYEAKKGGRNRVVNYLPKSAKPL